MNKLILSISLYLCLSFGAPVEKKLKKLLNILFPKYLDKRSLLFLKLLLILNLLHNSLTKSKLI